MTFRFSRGILIVFASALGVLFSCSAQAVDESHCFHLRVTKDGQLVQNPPSVTFLDKTERRNVDGSDGRFCVPEEMAVKEALDCTFVIGKERLYLSSISTFRFKADWDVVFGKHAAVSEGWPKSADRKKACSVTFHQGEPEV
jgi:hypothetical protein